jgi:hypothetical protein
LQVTFETAKNGIPVCSVNNIRLHSSYDPIREAERFVANLNQPLEPSVIVVTEPALSYCKSFLASRFPNVILCAIRYTMAFSESDTLWNTVFYAEGKTSETFSEELFTAFGEAKLLTAAFFTWEPSERAFPQISKLVWQGIKLAMRKSRDVLETREFFAKRWIKNAVRFAYDITFPATIQNGTMPVLIAASGPSLKACLPFIAEFREQFFVIGLSSAIEALIRAGIQPDIAMTTDGGYWAKEHLSILCQNSDISLACSAESAVPAAVLAKNPIIPLAYSGGFDALILHECGIPAMKAERNGTVAGTAACFALSITAGDVFFCGLDLAAGIGFHHTNPNRLDMRSRPADFRLKPMSHRLATASFSSGALAVYRSWFASRSPVFTGRVYRISAEPYSEPLGALQDLSLNAAKAKLSLTQEIKQKVVVCDDFLSKNSRARRITILEECLKKNTTSEVFLKILFPAGYLNARYTDKLEQLKENSALFCKNVLAYNLTEMYTNIEYENKNG